MQIVIPMSGSGSRFTAAGYTTLKPLIEVEGRPIIEHVVNLFPGETDFVFICTDHALARTPLGSVLKRICPQGRIVSIAPHKRGPVHAVLQAREFIDLNAPVIVNYCDFSMQWSYAGFKDLVSSPECAGALAAYRGFHPHSLGPNLYAYMRHHGNHLVEIREKHCFTNQRMQEYASTGTYYFRSGDLLLRYFDQAVALNLQTNGEFYASSPYNLLVRDGLEVLIYETERFFQWGTPEDLEEYLGWSNYFLDADSTDRRILSKATILMTMAGSGARFVEEGYKEPKPLIEIDGEPMVSLALKALPTGPRTIVVCRSQHARHPAFSQAMNTDSLNERTPVEIITADQPTQGQASTCLLARHDLDPSQPVLVAPCDTVVGFDRQEYERLANLPNVDCLVWTFQNHPHANRHPEQYAWTVLAPDQSVLRVLGKQIPPGEVRKASGVAGIFWFRQAADLIQGADQLIASGSTVKGEFYVDTVIEILIRQGLRVLGFPLQHYICLGTPEDVRTYEYWAPYFRELRTRASDKLLR